MILWMVSAAGLLWGCTLMIEGQEEGRPCKDGLCPYGYYCDANDRCQLGVKKTETEVECTTSDECSCEDGGVPACGEDGFCRCMSFQGRFDGVGSDIVGREGRFNLVGSRVGSGKCSSDDTEGYKILGGITQ